jgi:hypothetical protein
VTVSTDRFDAATDSAAVERVVIGGVADWTTKLAAWQTLREQEETAALLDSGEALFAVPFSLAQPGSSRVVRGVIDGLVRRPDGSIVVLVLAMGAPAPQDEENLAQYLKAARQMFPGADVNGRTLYCNR